MALLGWIVLFGVFVDELLAIAALAVWGHHAGGTWLAIAAALGTVLVWYLLASPKARFGGPVVRPLTKVVVFSLASAGLWVAGHEWLAAALLAYSVVVNGLAQLPSVRVLVAD